MTAHSQAKVMSAKIRQMTAVEKENNIDGGFKRWGDYGDTVVEAELSDGSTQVIHKYFKDEHIHLPHEFRGKTLEQIRRYIHQEYVEYFQS